MRRALLEQPLVVARGRHAPPAIRVIGALIRQDEHFLVKLDHPVVVVCHAGIVMAEGDIVWRRPESGARSPDRYDGPPAPAPIPADFRPPVEEPTAAPRPLPSLDHDAIDAAERRAALLTYALALAALAITILIACSRLA